MTLAPSSSTTAEAQEEQKTATEESKFWTEEEQRIAEIARKAYFAQGGGDEDRTQIDQPFKYEDGTWSVVFWPLPAVPGGQSYVDIGADGKVLGITGGK